MKGCKTVAEYAIKKRMKDNGFAMSEFSVDIIGNEATITGRAGDSMKVRYDCRTRKVEAVK